MAGKTSLTIKDYEGVEWVNGQTPLNAKNLEIMDTGILDATNSLKQVYSGIQDKSILPMVTSGDIAQGVIPPYVSVSNKTSSEAVKSFISNISVSSDASNQLVVTKAEVADFPEKVSVKTTTISGATSGTPLVSSVTVNDSNAITVQKTNDVKKIAFTADYNDLTNKPSSLSQFTNDVGYVTNSQISFSYSGTYSAPMTSELNLEVLLTFSPQKVVFTDRDGYQTTVISSKSGQQIDSYGTVVTFYTTDKLGFKIYSPVNGCLNKSSLYTYVASTTGLSSLPTPTSEDNGKTLIVLNEQWTLGSPEDVLNNDIKVTADVGEYKLDGRNYVLLEAKNQRVGDVLQELLCKEKCSAPTLPTIDSDLSYLIVNGSAATEYYEAGTSIDNKFAIDLSNHGSYVYGPQATNSRYASCSWSGLIDGQTTVSYTTDVSSETQTGQTTLTLGNSFLLNSSYTGTMTISYSKGNTALTNLGNSASSEYQIPQGTSQLSRTIYGYYPCFYRYFTNDFVITDEWIKSAEVRSTLLYTSKPLSKYGSDGYQITVPSNTTSFFIAVPSSSTDPSVNIYSNDFGVDTPVKEIFKTKTLDVTDKSGSAERTHQYTVYYLNLGCTYGRDVIYKLI